MFRVQVLAGILFAAAPICAAATAELPTLQFLAAVRIANKSDGLNEPSGLALSEDGDRLWTVSDDTHRVFQIGLDGDVKRKKSFDIDAKGLEGIATDAETGRLLAVKEETSEILVLDPEAGKVLSRIALSAMNGYDRIEAWFRDGPPNKGLEGITVDPATGRVYLLKEAEPRLLIEVAPDLGTITEHRILSAEAGFTDDDRMDDRIDVSGVAFDPLRGKFWIVSDEAQRLYLYDWSTGRAASTALVWDDDGHRRAIEHAEGVSVDRSGRRLYIVNDDGKRSRLFIYEIR